MIGLQIDGNDESAQLAQAHSLKQSVQPWNDPAAGYIAKLIAVQEGIRNTRHVIIDPETGAALFDPGLRLAWAYQTVKEDRNYLPGTPNPRWPFAVLHLPIQGVNGIQLDAQTKNSDPAYHMFWVGKYRGKSIVSETWQFGMIGDHVTLDATWGLFPVGGSPVPGPTPTPTPQPSGDPKGDLLSAISTISQETLRARDALMRLG